MVPYPGKFGIKASMAESSAKQRELRHDVISQIACCKQGEICLGATVDFCPRVEEGIMQVHWKFLTAYTCPAVSTGITSMPILQARRTLRETSNVEA